jgi:hypothetical protein
LNWDDKPLNRNLLLRFAALTAAFSIALLRKELDPRAGYVVLVTLFYIGAYLTTAFSPVAWATFRIGFSSGLAISMCPALVLLIAMNTVGFPPSPTVGKWAYVLAFVTNLVLFGIAVGSWISSRQQLANRAVARYFLLGLGYPYLAFALIAYSPFVR